MEASEYNGVSAHQGGGATYITVPSEETQNGNCKSDLPSQTHHVAHNTGIDPYSPTKMTMKDVKAIHAQVQSRIVREASSARISRGPVTIGELFDALLQGKNFDPLDHCFPNLPDDYFARMSAADRVLTAWNFIEPTRAELGRAMDSKNFCAMPTESRKQISNAFETLIKQAGRPSVTVGKRYQQSSSPVQPAAVYYGHDYPIEIESNGMMAYAPSAYMALSTAPPYIRPEPVLGHHTSAPQAWTPQFAQFPPKASQVMVPYGPVLNVTGPVTVNQFGSVSSPIMEATQPPTTQQMPTQRSHKADPRTRASSIDVQFKTSRHRMDGQHFTSIGTAQGAAMAPTNLPSSYKGEMTYHSILNAQCPENMNTSVHIEGFPPGTSEAQILSVIRFAAVRNICLHRAVPGRYGTAAADVTFYTREAAEYCFSHGNEGEFKFKGSVLKFLWNKNKCRPADADEIRQSRVILIEGPAKAVSIRSVEHLLRQKLVFNLAQKNLCRTGNGQVLLMLEFCKLRGQARCAKKLLEEVYNKLGVEVNVSYGPDPCGLP